MWGKQKTTETSERNHNEYICAMMGEIQKLESRIKKLEDEIRLLKTRGAEKEIHHHYYHQPMPKDPKTAFITQRPRGELHG